MSQSLSLVRKCSRAAAITLVMSCISLVSVSVGYADLIAYYNFNDSSDPTLAADTSGNGFDGDVVGPATYAGAASGFSGEPGDQAMDFGAFNNGAYVDIPAVADGALDPLIDSQDVSISLWVFGGPSQPVSQWTFYFGAADNPGVRQLGSHIPWGNSQVYWDVSDCCDPDERINAPIQPDQFTGQWNHYVFIKDQDSTAIYIDGEHFLDSGGNSINDIRDIGVGRIASGPNGENSHHGMIDDFGIFDEVLSPERIAEIYNGRLPLGQPPVPFTINGRGETYFQDFDEMTADGRRAPKGWSGEDIDGTGSRIDSQGLVDGPLAGAVETAEGIVNVGGNADRFSTPADGRLGTWNFDSDGNDVFDGDDVSADAAVDRALGNARVDDADPGKLFFEVEIAGAAVRAVTLDWDLEIWGGDPEAAFRGSEGGGYSVDLSLGGISYFSDTVSLLPGDLFDSAFDLAPGATHDPTLINGNEHSIRGNNSGIVEVSPADGAVGNIVQLTFDADHGGSDGGWITAVDNVQVRALAAGDAQADGDVDPADLIQLLAGGAFGQGNIDATWGQGDFDNDGDFDGTDILAVVQGLAGEFPKVYSHDPGNGVPDVLINPATGNITLDTNGTTIGSIVMDSAAGIFNGPNSPSWDAPGDFAADIDTQISMPISFTNPGYTGVDDLGDGIIGDLAPGFDILADLTIKYLDPNGDLLDAEAHVVPEPSSIVLAIFGMLGLLGYIRRRRLG